MSEETNADSIVEISHDNPSENLKEEDSLTSKYFNGGKVVLTRIEKPNKRNKSKVIKQPIVKLV